MQLYTWSYIYLQLTSIVRTFVGGLIKILVGGTVVYTVNQYRNLTLRLLMSYIYGAHILDVSRSHTTTQHSR